ncbi:MAG TPA: hypothetical protein VN445_11575 [Rectinemataceae bacterium]|nr:hypothetical protein [Rectinemataceae bacterium]
MKARISFSARFKRRVSLILLLALAVSGAFGDFLWFKVRNPAHDIAKIAGGKLNFEEEAIADMVMSYYAVKFGYAKDGAPLKDAVKKMTDEQYKNAIAQAAKICKNDAAKGFYRMGKAGEKLLKAIIQTIEDAAMAAGEWVDKKSDKFDSKK